MRSKGMKRVSRGLARKQILHANVGLSRLSNGRGHLWERPPYGDSLTAAVSVTDIPAIHHQRCDLTRLILYDRGMEPNMPRPITIRAIQDAVARHYNVTLSSEMLSTRRRNSSRPRHVAMFLAMAMTTHSSGEIARYFDCGDGTVLYAAKKIARLVETDAATAGDIMAIRAELEAG